MKETVYTLPPNGDDNKGDGYLAAGWVLVATAALSTAIRVIARARLTRNLGWDDFWIVVTMISNLVGLGFVTTEVLRDGLGRHMYYLTAEQRKDFTILGWLDWMQTFITIMFCKISICMFLLRIKNTRVNQTFMYILIALNVILTTVICGLFIGICSPPAAYWTIGLDGVCFSTERVMAFILAQGSVSPYTCSTTIRQSRKSAELTSWYHSIFGNIRHCPSDHSSLVPERPPHHPSHKARTLHPHGRRLHVNTPFTPMEDSRLTEPQHRRRKYSQDRPLR